MSTPVFVKYKTTEERVEAFRRMVNMRQQWEEHVREIVAQRQNMPTAQ